MKYAKLGETDPAPYRDDKGNRTIRMGAEGTLYRGFVIQPLHHAHPHRIFAHPVSGGYTVTDGSAAIMPGATWHQTVFGAMTAIDDYITAQSLGRGPGGEHAFWALSRFRHNCEERAPELATLLEEVFQHAEVRLPGDLFGRIRDALNQIDANCDTRDSVIDVTTGARTKLGERQTGRFGF